MATLDIYPPVSLYLAGRFSYLPRKAHVEDFALAMNVDEDSLWQYAFDHDLFSPGDVIRSCDLQLQMSDDVEQLVTDLESTRGQMKTYLQRLANAYRCGMPCHVFLG